MGQRSSLRLDDLRMPVHLGVPDEERAEPQEITVSIVFEFDSPPGATATDAIEATIDYGVVCRSLARELGARPVRTIEHLARRGLDYLESVAGGECDAIALTVRKFPAIDGLVGGAAFTLHWSRSS